MGVLRLVCGAEAHVAEDRARLLEPPWVRGWYQIVRNLELVTLVVERPCGAAWSQAAAASVTCGSMCAGGARRHLSPGTDCGDLSVESGGRATGAGGVACGAGVMGCVYCCSLWMALWLCDVSCLQGARGVQEGADRGPSTDGACHVI